MKKILALLLAVLLLTTVAFADSDMIWGTIEETDDSYLLFYPGAKISVAGDIMDQLWDSWDYSDDYTQNNSKYFTISLTFSRGEDLIKDMYWEDGDYIIELKDYDEVTDEDNDIVVSSLTVKLNKGSKSHYVKLTKDGSAMTFDAGKINGETIDSFSWDGSDVSLGAIWDVGYNYHELADDGEPDDFDDFDGDWADGIMYYGSALDNTPYYLNASDDAIDVDLSDLVQGSADFALDVNFTLKAGQWFMMTSYENGRDDYDEMEEVFDELTEDAEYAYLFGFEGSTLKTKATFTLGADEDAFIYKIDADGNLSTSGFKWDDDDEVWKLSTRDLSGCYILSDIELSVSASSSSGSSDEDATNPDTGANDVVGIASALAVVALISGAAISLKK